MENRLAGPASVCWLPLGVRAGSQYPESPWRLEMAQPGTHLLTVLSEAGHARRAELQRGWLNGVAARDRLLLTAGLILASGVSPGGPGNVHGYFQ